MMVKRISISKGMYELAQGIHLRQHYEYDFVGASLGAVGVGKSTFAIELGLAISRLNKLKFSLDKNIIYAPTYEELIRRLKELPLYSVLIIDEAIRTMYKRNWSRAGQKELNEVFTLIRQKYLAIILCIPSLDDLDSYYIRQRLVLIFHVFVRGRVYVLARSSNIFNPDPYYMKKANVLYETAEFKGGNEVIKVVRKLPNFIMWFRFAKLPEKLENSYKELKARYTLDLEKQESQLELKQKQTENLLIEAIKELYDSSTKWTIGKLAARFGLTAGKVRKILQVQEEVI
jgi:hypothetical protein